MHSVDSLLAAALCTVSYVKVVGQEASPSYMCIAQHLLGALPMRFQRMHGMVCCLVGFMVVRVLPSLSAHLVYSELRLPELRLPERSGLKSSP